MKIGEYTILDGNGDPIEECVRYINRYQSTLPHILTSLNFRLKTFRTVGGFHFTKPVVYCVAKYLTGKRCGSMFESTCIDKGIYAFDQLIPKDKGITLSFDYCNTNSMIEAYKKKLGLDKPREPEPKKISNEKEIELAQKFFNQIWYHIEDLDDTIYEDIDPECEVEGICDFLNNDTVLEVLKLGFKQKYGQELNIDGQSNGSV